MGDRTGIAWTDATWNPLRGCSRESEGCRHCYAERVASRFSGPGLPYEGLARDGRWTGKVRFIEEHLADPLRWQKPRRIFVNSMSDLFHPNVPDEWIDRIFAVMAISPRHTFQVLTKRPKRMLRYLSDRHTEERTARASVFFVPNAALTAKGIEADLQQEAMVGWAEWPLPNVWLGVSVEDQRTADERVPLLLQTPAAVRFVSYEPALGPVDFTDIVLERSAGGETHFDALTCDVPAEDDGPYLGRTLDWIIVGGESGQNARLFDVEWARRTRDACKRAGVAFFYKQGGASNRCAHDSNGGHLECFPIDLQVREFPDVIR